MANGQVFAKARVLPTERGHNLQVIIKNGGSLGVSAKGNGMVVKNEKGLQEVTEYVLEGIDFVTVPAAGTWVGKENIVESKQFISAPFMTKEEVLRQKYRFAVSAVYQKSFDEYCRIDDDKQLYPQWLFWRKCGYNKSFEDFVKSKKGGKNG